MASNVDLFFRVIGQDKTGPSLKAAAGNIEKVDKASKDAAKSADQLKKQFGDLGDKAKDQFGKVAKYGAAAAGALTIAFGVKAAKAASDLNESINAVNVTFGEAAESINALGIQSVKTVGLSRSQFNSLAVQFSNFATTVAGDGGDVGKVMADLTGRAADFASVMDMDVAEAATLFQSGLAGETEPLRRYGIDLSAAAVEAHAMAVGISDGTGELTEQQKVMARYSLIMQQTNKTAGDFANTQGSMSNQLKKLRGNFEDFSAAAGQALTPIAEAILPKVNELLTEMADDINANLPGIQSRMKDFGTEVGAVIDRMGGWDGIKASLEGVAGTVMNNWPAIQSTFENVAAAVERTSGFVGVLWDAFQKLPPEVQTILAMFAIAQKAGVVKIALTAADAVKDLVSNITAAVVNVNGPVTGGLDGGKGKGGVGGKLATAGKTAVGVGSGAAVGSGATTGLGIAGAGAVAGGLGAGAAAGVFISNPEGTKKALDDGGSTVGRFGNSFNKAGQEIENTAGILSRASTVITYSKWSTDAAREATQRNNAAVAQSRPLTLDAANAITKMGSAAANSAKTTGLLAGAIHAAGTASGLTDAQVQAMTSAVLSVPANASLPQLQSAIGYAGRAAGLTASQIQGVTASVLAVPRDGNLPALRDAIGKAGAAAGLTDSQTQAMTAAVLAVPAGASVPQLRDAIEKAGKAAGLTDTQIQGVTASALKVPRDTPANVTTNAPKATSEVETLQSTINSLTGKTLNIRLGFTNDAGFSDSRATYYGSGGGGGSGIGGPANSEPDMETFVMKAIKSAIPDVFPGGGGSGPWRKPAAGYTVSSEWMRGGNGIHYGIDLAGPMGTPIFAASAGSVAKLIRSNTGYGNMLEISHGGGLSTLYAHLAGFAPGLGVGSSVLPGSVIGAMGSTGDSTGPHLHFETKQGGVPQEPRNFMAGRGVFFDSGGWLEPGITMAVNATGKPEPIFTSEQWAAMTRNAGNDGAGASEVLQPIQFYLDGQMIEESIVRLQRNRGGVLGFQR